MLKMRGKSIYYFLNTVKQGDKSYNDILKFKRVIISFKNMILMFRDELINDYLVGEKGNNGVEK